MGREGTSAKLFIFERTALRAISNSHEHNAARRLCEQAAICFSDPTRRFAAYVTSGEKGQDISL